MRILEVIFNFSTTSPLKVDNSEDIPGGVYGIIMRLPYTYLATRSATHEFQVWDDLLSQKLFEIPLGFQPHGYVCDRSDFYFGTGDRTGIGIITNR